MLRASPLLVGAQARITDVGLAIVVGKERDDDVAFDDCVDGNGGFDMSAGGISGRYCKA